jgi:hypothetical protein
LSSSKCKWCGKKEEPRKKYYCALKSWKTSWREWEKNNWAGSLPCDPREFPRTPICEECYSRIHLFWDWLGEFFPEMKIHACHIGIIGAKREFFEKVVKPRLVEYPWWTVRYCKNEPTIRIEVKREYRNS